jgi:hypothetical protein
MTPVEVKATPRALLEMMLAIDDVEAKRGG